METSLKSLLEIISWLNWWMVTVLVLTNSTQAKDVVKVYFLFNVCSKAMVNLCTELDQLCSKAA